MSVMFKRTAKAYREDVFDMPYRVYLKDGSQQYNVKVAPDKDISDYCCGLELSGMEFHYIPDTQEVLYIISRMRNPRYRDGHVPSLDGVCSVWVTPDGEVWVRIGLARIQIYNPRFRELTDSERSEWRDHYVEWIESHLIEAETSFPT